MSTNTKPDSERFYDELRELTIEYHTKTMTVGKFLTEVVALYEAYVQDRETAARIDELNIPRTYNIDENYSDHIKQGFGMALEQVDNANTYRITQLSHKTNGGQDE